MSQPHFLHKVVCSRAKVRYHYLENSLQAKTAVYYFKVKLFKIFKEKCGSVSCIAEITFVLERI